MGVSGQRHSPRERTPDTHWKEAVCASELVWTQRLQEISFASTRDQTPVVWLSSLYQTLWLTYIKLSYPNSMVYMLIYNFIAWNVFQSQQIQLTSSAVRLWPWGVGITTRRFARPAAGECCLACWRFLLDSTGLGPGPGEGEPPSGDDELG
jgi:hypothetical protein